MSPLEIQRLSPVSRPLFTQTEQRSASAGGAGAEASAAAAQKGVAVESRGELAGAKPPVDSERVDEIRAALRDGTYPILPAKIVDALIASQLLPVVER